MEHIVRLVKDNLKAVHSNKTEKTMAKRTSALSGMKVITNKFDVTSNTLIRASRHKIPSSIEDEQLIIHSLLLMQPFSCVPGRQMPSYTNPVQSPLKKMNIQNMVSWIREHQYLQLNDIGKWAFLLIRLIQKKMHEVYYFVKIITLKLEQTFIT